MHRLSRIDTGLLAIMLIVVSMLAGSSSALAQAEKPAPVRSMVLIMTKADDVDDSKIHENIFKALSARAREVEGVQILDFRSALGPTASRLKDDQIKQMLEFPELIPRTDHIRRNLHADGVLLGDVTLFGKAGKNYYISVDMTYYDLHTQSNEGISISTVDYKAEMDKDKFYLAAADRINEQLRREIVGMGPVDMTPVIETRVVCNKNSKLFHLPQSHHLPVSSVPTAEMSRREAVEAGYKPCPICFQETQKRLNPETTEAMLGAETAGFIEYYYRVSNDPERHARLERIGQKILADNGFAKRRYVFTALNSDEINAFAAPAGYVYVTTGMMDAVESDDELASVIAHEIAHVEKEHGVRQYRRAQSAATLGLLASILTGTNLSILSDFVRELVLRGYDRSYEEEADRYGYMYTRRTDYNPEAMFTVLGKLYDMELGSNVKIVSWMRTHPKSQDRIKYVSEYKGNSSAAERYLTGLGPVDAGLASAVQSDELRYVERVEDFRKYVDVVKALP